MLKLYTSKEFNEGVIRGKLKTTIIAGNGIFELMSSWLGESVRKANNYETVVFPNLEESISFYNRDNYPIIPKEALLYIMKWYADTTKKNNKEAQVNFYNTKGLKSITVDEVEVPLDETTKGIKVWEKNLISYTPIQVNHTALTKADDPIYDVLNKSLGLYVETHSHNSMDAFASSTDIANSENDAIQLVFGKLNTDTFVMHTWGTVRGVTEEYLSEETLSKFIELPKHSLYSNGKYLFDSSLIKDIKDDKLFNEWYSQVKENEPHYYNRYQTPYAIHNNKYNIAPRLDSYNDYYDIYDDYEIDDELSPRTKKKFFKVLTKAMWKFNLSAEDVYDIVLEFLKYRL